LYLDEANASMLIFILYKFIILLVKIIVILMFK
jgi:hypothetical protein